MGPCIDESRAEAAGSVPGRRRVSLSWMIAAAFGSASVGLAAQTVPDAPADGESRAGAAPQGGAGAQKIESVVITATRRREPAREVPMQVNTLATEELERAGAKTLHDYLSGEAGVDVKSSGGTGLGSVSMRGVTTGGQTSATVGIYVDELAVGSSSAYANGALLALDLGLLDLNRIEVLRGPQGTLYGAGAMGGVLKYVTNEPDASLFSGKVSAGLASTRAGRNGNVVNAVVNVPVAADVAAVRVSAFHENVGGYVDAVGPAAGQDINRGDTTGVRASVLATPADKLKLRLTATGQDIKRDGRDVIDYGLRTGQPVEGDLKRRLWLREHYTNKVELYSAEIEYDFGWARLDAATGRQTVRLDGAQDASGTYVPLLNRFGVPVVTVGGQARTDITRTTQEFRLTSRADQRLEWLAGLYYDHETGGNTQHFVGTLVGGAVFPGLFDASLPSTYKEYAGYGDLTWKFEGGLAVTGGLRVARNDQTFTQDSAGLLLGGRQSIRGESSDTSTTYLLTARHALTPKSAVYGRVASGYRPGGPNAAMNDIGTGRPLAPPTFEPDTLVSYEVGYKADLLDNALSMQAAAYDIEWKDVQQYQTVNGISVIVNAGKARVRGLEFSTTYRATRQLHFNANLAAVDAKLTADAAGLGAKSGARLPNSARFSGAVGVQVLFDLGEYPAHVGLVERYVGERNAGFDGSPSQPNYALPAYAVTDLQAGLEFKHLNLALYARNLFDKRAQTSASTAAAALGQPVQVVVEQPRTVGVNLTVPF